jgi:hypothetical protein
MLWGQGPHLTWVEGNMRGNQKVPGIILHWRVYAPSFHTTCIEYYWSLLCSNVAEVARCSWEEAVRQVAEAVVSASWSCTEPHIASFAAIPNWERSSCHHPSTAISVSRSEWRLDVPTLKIGPKGTCFLIMEDTKLKATAKLRKIPKRNLLPVLKKSKVSL